MRFFILAVLIFLSASLTVFAQELPVNPPSAAANEYDDVRDEYLQEAQQFFNECRQDYNMSQYFDCECLTVEYLDNRIESGPEKDSRNILLDIRGKCHDATLAAGETYNSCMTNGTIFPPGQDPEAYCACLGNTYAKLFEKSERNPSARTYMALQAQAHDICRNNPPK